MRLLVDLQGMQNQSRQRGIGRYVANFARGLLRNQGQHEICFLLNARYPERIQTVIEAFHGLADPSQFLIFEVPGPTAALRVEDAWRAGAAHILYERLVANLAPDVLLIGSLFEGGSDDTVLSVGEDRAYLVAAILYDLIPLLNPAEHIGSDGARLWYHRKVDEARSADLLLGISHSACREGIEHLPSDDAHVQYVGAAAGDEFANAHYRSFRGHPIASEVMLYHGISRPYLMHTSALDPRKNFPGLVAAFAQLPKAVRSEHQLVLVCKLNSTSETRLRRVIAEAGLGADEVVLTGYVEDDELRVLYANCSLFVFPSFHEGFGLPVLEAMWCGAPAVGSKLSSVPEVIGRDDALFDPYDPGEMAAVICRALTDLAFRTELLAHAHKHARAFSWDSVALRGLRALEAALATRPTQPSSMTNAERAISRIAAFKCWARPNDLDLLDTARALAANEKLHWPEGTFANFTIPQTGTSR
jgi:glycosyltransferase involved in cell wall biosynthesis